MAAGVVASEKLTLAVPIASVKCNLVRTVVSVKISFEPGDTYAFFLFRIFPGLVNLPYEARVHHHLQGAYPRPDELILGSRGAKVKTHACGKLVFRRLLITRPGVVQPGLQRLFASEKTPEKTPEKHEKEHGKKHGKFPGHIPIDAPITGDIQFHPIDWSPQLELADRSKCTETRSEAPLFSFLKARATFTCPARR
jgi:hypothetical protein